MRSSYFDFLLASAHRYMLSFDERECYIVFHTKYCTAVDEMSLADRHSSSSLHLISPIK